MFGAWAEAALKTVMEFVLEVFCYHTARILVPVFTFGRVEVEPDAKGQATRAGTLALQKQADGRWLMEAQLAALIGLLFWALMGAFAFLLWWLW